MAKAKSTPKSSHQPAKTALKLSWGQILLVVIGLILIGWLAWLVSRPSNVSVSSNGGNQWDRLMKQYGCSSLETLQTSSSGPCVKLLQFIVQLGDNQIGGPPAINGQFDQPTIAYVKQFQTQNGLAASGTVDGPTWSKLKSCVSLEATSVTSIWTCQRLTP